MHHGDHSVQDALEIGRQGGRRSGFFSAPLVEEELHTLRVQYEECLLGQTVQEGELLELLATGLQSVVALRHRTVVVHVKVGHQSGGQIDR